VQALKVSLPWLATAVADTRRVLGEDYWPYGVTKNLHAIEAVARWHHAQGLSARQLQIEDMFFRTTLDS
jgi:4,5-dihydroxyphthalate decarboxylase